jgi:hypothetical protein
MKIPDYEREDPGELEELNRFFSTVAEKLGVQSSPALQPLVDRMTRQIEFLTQALSRRLNARDNFNSDVRTIDFEDLVAKTIRPNIIGPVKEVRIRQTFPRSPFLVPRMLDWATTGPGEIQVIVKWDTAPTDPVSVEIVIEGD